MEIKEIILKENFEKFENTSDEYTDISLIRSDREITRISYNDTNFYFNIGENGKINQIKIIKIQNIIEKIDIEEPTEILKGEVIFEKLNYEDNYNLGYIESRDINFNLELSPLKLLCYFDENKDFYYGVQISEEIIILVGENNIMKGILIYGKFKIENDRFYYEK